MEIVTRTLTRATACLGKGVAAGAEKRLGVSRRFLLFGQLGRFFDGVKRLDESVGRDEGIDRPDGVDAPAPCPRGHDKPGAIPTDQDAEAVVASLHRLTVLEPEGSDVAVT